MRSAKHKDRRISFVRIDKNLRKEAKLAWLDEHVSIGGIPWQSLTPDEQNTWLVPEHAEAFAEYMPVGSRAVKTAKRTSAGAIFKTYGRGVATCRDDVVWGFNQANLVERVKQFIDDYNGEVDRYKRTAQNTRLDDFVRYEKIKWSESLKSNVVRGRYAEFEESQIRSAIYRPFCRQSLFFNETLVERRYQFPQIFPTKAAEDENRSLMIGGYGRKQFAILITHMICDLNFYADPVQCFPFYVYDEDGTNRRENITDWALKQFRAYYKDKKLTKWDIFYYVYGLLHNPGYRTKFADNLKRDLPRIPFAPDFRAFAVAGKELAELHLNYETLDPYDLQFVETPDVPFSYVVEKMKLSADKTSLRVNESLTLTGIPPEVFDYRLGNRSALDWVIDQYRVTEDKRSGVRSDPNRPDDPEAIVRLVGQVVRVSVETVRIVKALPEQFAAPAAG